MYVDIFVFNVIFNFNIKVDGLLFSFGNCFILNLVVKVNIMDL